MGSYFEKLSGGLFVMSDTGFLFSESVNGMAERQKILGRKDAEKVLGEVLSDSVNKLDIRRLLQ